VLEIGKPGTWAYHMPRLPGLAQRRRKVYIKAKIIEELRPPGKANDFAPQQGLQPTNRAHNRQRLPWPGPSTRPCRKLIVTSVLSPDHQISPPARPHPISFEGRAGKWYPLPALPRWRPSNDRPSSERTAKASVTTRRSTVWPVCSQLEGDRAGPPKSNWTVARKGTAMITRIHPSA